ncbi:MAG: methyltransferase domain-containing protein [Spirochaetaceae bacterium]|jgi:2-polyprenyl-3-methyl-5-hydroxy-6-metoxy-1,4-benzoquinol methylase|nr:methyltransferase domain-containing protein [Spirochaetaceae bacterium]
MTRRKPVLVIASFEKGRGSGHLVRSGLLVRDLRLLGREAALYLPRLGNGRTEDEARAVLSQSIENPDDIPLIRDEAAFLRDWDFVIFDRFSTPMREIGHFLGVIPVIGIDEGGPERPRFDFLLDLLPLPPSRSPPNATRPDLLCLPAKRKEGLSGNTDGGFSPPIKILVSFGGEDEAGLGIQAARACSVPGLSEVTLVCGALNKDREDGAAFTRVPFIKNLREHLAEYDLLITHFGLSAFEALYAGVPVLLVSPSRLHEELARAASLVSAGRGNKGVALLRKRLLFSGGRLNAQFLHGLSQRCAAAALRHGLAEPQRENLACYVNRLEPKVFSACPLCGSADCSATVRFEDRTYRRCPRCGTFYMSRAVPPDIEYTEAYFFENYKKQYGKTYLEDFPNLTAMACRRLAVIKGLIKTGGGSGGLLDIGCAYGAFLVCAREAGFAKCQGIDVSASAVKYVRGELRLQAECGFFPEDELTRGGQKFDVITLWYVIEHFENVKTVLEKIHGLLNPGGVLAFSTPNCSGISALRSLKNFLEKSPADHWTIWDARRVKKVLRHFGFDVKKIIVTGHHPERFPICPRLADKRGPVYKALTAFSRMFRLGDTFEVYAKKI